MALHTDLKQVHDEITTSPAFRKNGEACLRLIVILFSLSTAFQTPPKFLQKYRIGTVHTRLFDS